MTTDARTQAEALVSALEHRLAAISAQQHQLAVEKSRLVEQLTPLRLGVVAPDTAVVQLKAQGIMLRGLTTARATAQRPRRAMLKAVAPLRPVVPSPAEVRGMAGTMTCPTRAVLSRSARRWPRS